MKETWSRWIRRSRRRYQRFNWATLNIDPWLLLMLLVIMAGGLMVLYSAGGESMVLVKGQALRLLLAVAVMLCIAQIPPRLMMRLAWLLYLAVTLMLLAVDLIGSHAMGAQRWLEIPGLFRFQPSELMKLVMPMMLASYLARRQLPPSWMDLIFCVLLIVIPVGLIADQPDLGTSLLVAASAVFVILLAGLSWRVVGICALMVAAVMPLLWFNMHDYQRQRVMTFLNPESDPLGTGWNIIQSKTAIGSGGLWGKGWMQGTQSQLEFLPERHTDFIVAVLGEEFGLIGMMVLLSVYLLLIWRGLYMAAQAPDTFGRLAGGSIVLTFFVYVFVNVGMVSGLLPIVGVPLPLISFGGTSSVTLLAGFGILMAVFGHRKMSPR
ncbi:cell elongation-specific peptidoglycan biosynthesis regulator RodA [Kushneria sinocarnis]|uniref:Peptidoglycan glycosyltransferase MrdB n=1 Tax=Kushneria sinocarnis TaxID=595502 RepID=A0A420WZ01_9GAMM|nr:rod shape-determining protein RodA [Kushneria sinocarnis]RKR06408.1 cell elongation-specific peptidoglycan biosynthesis regulator RodA [Kushneria sinocarnis]